MRDTPEFRGGLQVPGVADDFIAVSTSMKTMGLKILCFTIAMFFLPSLTFADSRTFIGPASPKIGPATPGQFGQEVLRPDPLQTSFYRAFLLIQEGKHAEAAESLSKLRVSARERGFENLPTFSSEILEHALAIARLGRSLEERAFLVKQAAELSPTEPRVQLAVAGFTKLLGAAHSFRAFWRSVKSMSQHPSMVMALAINLLLLVLVALTLSLLFVFLVQLARYGNDVLVACGDLFPSRLAGLMGAALLAILLCAPIFGGPLLMIACWGMLLARARPACRWCGVVAGVLVLLWGLAIPVASRVGHMTRIQSIRDVEAVSAGSFLPGVTGRLRAQVIAEPKDTLRRAVYAKSLQLDGEFAAAKAEYQFLRSLAEGEATVKSFSNLNEAILAFSQGELSRAREILSGLHEQNGESFEVLWGLALTHLGELDTAAHRKFYEQTKEADSYRLGLLGADAGEKMVPVFGRVAASTLAARLFQPQIAADLPLLMKWEAREERLASTLLRGASAPFLVGFGAILLALAFALKDSASAYFGRRHTVPEVLPEPVLVWLLLPGGGFVAGNRPLLGCACVTLVVAVFLLALQTPLSLFPVFDVSWNRYETLLPVGICALVLASLVPALITRMGRSAAS